MFARHALVQPRQSSGEAESKFRVGAGVSGLGFRFGRAFGGFNYSVGVGFQASVYLAWGCCLGVLVTRVPAIRILLLMQGLGLGYSYLGLSVFGALGLPVGAFGFWGSRALVF